MIEAPIPADDAVARFADRVGQPGSPALEAPRPLPPTGGPARVKVGVRKVVKRVASPVTSRLFARVASIAEQAANNGDHRLRLRLDAMEGEVLRVERELDVERELLLSELDVRVDDLEALGYALAPSAGLSGAAERVNELRSRVNVLSRELDAVRSGTPPPAVPPPTASAAAPAPATDRGDVPAFDYVGFEQRFRGTSEQLFGDIDEHYGELLRASAAVLDLGCGRGELLEIVAAAGGRAVGVDLDADAIALAGKKPGIEAHLGDALAYLRDQPAGSFDAITAIQVVEHLEFDDVLRLVDLSFRALRPGGRLVMETPNPATLSVLGNNFVLDPTHVRPLHPSLLTFVCERAGFAEIDVRYYAPLESHHLPLLEPDAIGAATAGFNDALRRLNHVLFGPQDFAVVARAPHDPRSADDEGLAEVVARPGQ